MLRLSPGVMATVLLACTACGADSGATSDGSRAGSSGAAGAGAASGGSAGSAGAASGGAASGQSGAGNAAAGRSGDGGAGAAGGGAAGSGGKAPELPERPNIVVILTDDQGWKATSVAMVPDRSDSKSDFYETPNIERLSAQGVTFGAGYAAPNCSPSRLSLLTGKSPARLKLTDIIERKSGENYDGQLLLPPGHAKNPAGRIFAAPKGERTIAELLKAHDASYATAHFGKWHLAGGGPAEHGFDESDGATSNSEGQVGEDDPKLVYSLAERASGFIRRNGAKKAPFYLQISHYATHEQAFALPSTVAEFEQKTPGTIHDDPLFAAMTANLDESIGRVLDALKDPNGDGDDADSLVATTYVVLLADNGGVDSLSDNFPLRSGKASTFEGGVRVPFIVSGPGIAAGSRSQVPVDELDLLPTIADWTGASGELGQALDGGSLAALARGESSAVVGREDALVFHFPHYQVEKGSRPMSAMREGDYKLVHFYETGQSQLFDLSTDLGEEHDLAAQKPVVTRRLKRQLRDYLKQVEASMPLLNPELGAGKLPDVDQDGLPDAWEFRELLTTNYGAMADPDGDGVSNALEQAQGTDPLP